MTNQGHRGAGVAAGVSVGGEKKCGLIEAVGRRKTVTGLEIALKHVYDAESAVRSVRSTASYLCATELGRFTLRLRLRLGPGLEVGLRVRLWSWGSCGAEVEEAAAEATCTCTCMH